MLYQHQQGARWIFSLPALLLVITLSTGCASSGVEELAAEELETVSRDVIENIEMGANRVILEREGEGLDVEPAPTSFFADAERHFERAGFEIMSSNDDAMTFTTAPRYVENDLAMKIQVVVREQPGGSHLIASGMWAPALTTPEAEWEEAAFTSGMSAEAFDELIEVIGEIPSDGIGTDVQ